MLLHLAWKEILHQGNSKKDFHFCFGRLRAYETAIAGHCTTRYFSLCIITEHTQIVVHVCADGSDAILFCTSRFFFINGLLNIKWREVSW